MDSQRVHGFFSNLFTRFLTPDMVDSNSRHVRGLLLNLLILMFIV